MRSNAALNGPQTNQSNCDFVSSETLILRTKFLLKHSTVLMNHFSEAAVKGLVQFDIQSNLIHCT